MTTSAKNTRISWSAALGDLFRQAFLQQRIFRRGYAGIMHFMIFWGVVIQVLGTVVNLLQYPLFLPFTIPWPTGAAYLWFELVMDIAGGMILLGVLMAMARRAFFRPASLPSRWDDWLALVLLLSIVVIGFASEGMRLLGVSPLWRPWSPIGNLFANGLAALGVNAASANQFHGLFYWGHIISALGLVAVLPFTKMRHLLTGPLNMIVRPRRKLGELEKIEDIENVEKLGAGEIGEFSSSALVSFDACVQCGRCEDVCPAHSAGMPYSPRAVLRSLYENEQAVLVQPGNGKAPELIGGSMHAETPWMCTTCGACIAECPMLIDQVAPIIELRRYLTLTTGEIPGSVAEALTSMERRGNPWGLPKENFAPWLKEAGVRVLNPGEQTDVLLFVGCAFGYDNNNQNAGRAMVKLLQSAAVDFAVLGVAEGCCGETARRLGHEYVYQVMAEENVAAFESVKFNRIVTPCAHCFNTLKNEYPQFGGDYEVVHHSEYLAELLAAGRLPGSTAADATRFTMHDSCYLGRYNQIYQEPRRLLDSVPGLQRTELPRRLENSFCCGGGGGQMWLETDPNTRINRKRIDEVVEAGADVVVTACPYCLIMFDDAIRTSGIQATVKVHDIAEVLAGHLPPSEG